MTDPFAAIVGPTFQHVIDLLRRVEQGEAPALEDERREILARLDEARRQAGASSQLARDFELARYALIYWIDEVLIDSPWMHATEWRQRILEWDFFGMRVRADAFFERLEQAERLDTTDPLETFFLAIALGFRGKHAGAPEELHPIADRLYNRVAAGQSRSEKFLPDDPDGGEPLRPLPGQAILLAVSVLASLSVLFTLACFFAAIPPWR